MSFKVTKRFRIYLITCLNSGTQYVGKTIRNINTRFNQHYNEAKRQIINKRTHFQNSLVKYGKVGFIVEEIFNAFDKNKLNYMEIYFIKYYDTFYNGYNETTGGDGNFKKSDESILKQTNTQKINRKNNGLNNPFYGKKHTEESKQLIKKTNIENGFYKYLSNKMKGSGNPNFGKPFEHCVDLFNKKLPHKEFKGLSWNKTNNQYLINIVDNKKHYFIGGYFDKYQAAIAYDISIYMFRNGVGYLNFPLLIDYYKQIEFTNDLNKDKELIKNLSHFLLQYF